MEIKQAIFLFSTTDPDKRPENDLEEFAFIGRSNVGKSSLINILCRKPGLARTSSTPGKTQCINRFLIDGKWIITDLPGYGFAKVSKTKRAQIQSMIKGYISRSPRLTLLFVLLDSRHPLQQIDLDFLLLMGEWSIPFAIILTKTDKLSKTALEKQALSFRELLKAYWEPLPPLFAVSSKTSAGQKELLDYIGSILNRDL
ncbi:MAG: ribosome biogenesis GTP-binding protein YihA/YsxC [Bacteroidales bacterium]|jgi:GTP-binding protein|nr:ribosome biogenesis GTP-binding protein YihA/YsxC [Bacteroidales bacterium]MDD2264187.1 ribosome biogenesis GTP-binding protein YihA/YsxC [Bacteroidales bacterium]MDD2831341.1 ribosome biogenesis GTP-binding protein YihA/YsxC [Bacteroidales bacterium]MDD3208336.1 ribosome biogenesis GTP-binding protein YihA/YsxC [Bacteroidales bacterium]MDD3696981.1 ribosome biogenesis GTP-binding protein YihA/YsxC [Bacteroidales bacterium]